MKTATVSFVATLSLLVGVLERVRLLLDTGDDLFAGPFPIRWVPQVCDLLVGICDAVW